MACSRDTNDRCPLCLLPWHKQCQPDMSPGMRDKLELVVIAKEEQHNMLRQVVPILDAALDDHETTIADNLCAWCKFVYA